METIEVVGPHAVFKDSKEHFENALVRLLGWGQDEVLAWVRTVVESYRPDREQSFIAHLSSTTRSFFGLPDTARCEGSMVRMVEGNEELSIEAPNVYTFARLIHRQHGIVREDLRTYQDSYFSSHDYSSGGDIVVPNWRMEKGERFFERVKGFVGSSAAESPVPRGTAFLDVGAGVGSMGIPFISRGAVGWAVETNAACRHQLAKQGYTAVPALTDLPPELKVDYVMCYDVIEHISEPAEFLRIIGSHLKEDGQLVIRTPNLLALEYFVFDHRYHSLKKEHLSYFNPISLLTLLQSAGFNLQLLETDSHLLGGFMSIDMGAISQCRMGSDLFAIARRAAGNSAFTSSGTSAAV